MPSGTLLFIAEPQAVTGLFSRLKESGYEAGLADNLTGALNFIKKSNPCLVITRPRLQTYKAEDLLAQKGAAAQFPPVIVFAKFGSAEDAQRYLELGAKDYWLDPLQWEKIKLLLPAPEPESDEDEEDAPEPAPRAARPATPAPFAIIGAHPAVKRVLALARQVARSKATVLIAGESGTGKEMFARFLHSHSDRADKPFIAINCAALPEHLLESELFGHEKGSFTGAIARKMGKFELASGGTILLDEITEMDMGLQAKLLRVLQEGEIDRVGGVETVKVDVRVLATTNRDIEETVKAGKFRQDLFYRLNVIPLKLPALRDRGEDSLLLAQYFVDKFTRTYGMPALKFSDAAREWILSYGWPGNVRELQNLMERAVLLANKGLIEPSHFLLDPDSWQPDEADLDPPAPLPPGAQAVQPADGPTYEGELAVMPLHEMERRLIIKSLDQTSGNRTQAAELLGISVRTLRNKLNEYRGQGLIIP